MKYLTFVFILLWTCAQAQSTVNPKVEDTSAQNVHISKVEIIEGYTVFHMYFYDKDGGVDFQQYFEGNPEIKKRFRDLGLSDKAAEQMFRRQFQSQQTISFQPNSYIKLSNGNKYKFIKAVDIPVSPERKNVEVGKKYYFKVYFEQIPAGFEQIDLIEFEKDSDGETNYWNFRGIEIINPQNRVLAPDSPLPTETAKDFRIFGKVLDSEGKTMNAKIVCYDAKTGVLIDSLLTSKSGKYEFLVNTEKVLFKVESHGYSSLEENLNLKFYIKQGEFEKDWYLDAENETMLGEETNEQTFKLDKVYFRLGDATLLAESHEQLDALVIYLNQNPELKIQIEGHTDNQGDEDANYKLSLDRAFAVREYLIKKGIPNNRIKFKGYGSSKPISPNDTEENRSKNRRVEYSFID